MSEEALYSLLHKKSQWQSYEVGPSNISISLSTSLIKCRQNNMKTAAAQGETYMLKQHLALPSNTIEIHIISQ